MALTTVVPYNPQASIRRSLRLAAIVLVLLVVGAGGLAANTGVSGAVIAQGQVVVASDVKKVQHPTGGVVADIRVRDGAHVGAGQVLLELDPTVASADASIVGGAVDALAARQARLQAERDSRPLSWPADLEQRRKDPAVAAAIRDETRLYQLRLTARQSQEGQLKERVVELKQEIDGYAGQAKAKQQEIALVQQELTGVRKLYAQSLVTLDRLNSLERAQVELNADIAQLQSETAEAQGKITEIQLQIIQLGQDARTDAGNQLNEVDNQLADLRQRQVAADDQYRRVVIKSPQDGVVDKLSVHAPGAVIAPGAEIMDIVPDKDRLEVEAKIRTSDIDKVKAAATAMLRFSAFNIRTTPELKGQVETVSADAHSDERTGASYYLVRIRIPPAEVARLGGLKLEPGMPVESFIQTQRRSMLSYLVKPLTDQFKRAFREE
jgi:HlyD family secretion protein